MRCKRLKPTFVDLPEEVVGDILSRLSVRHLLRLKCVCKCWRDLISSRWFASLQLTRSISNPTSHYLLLLNNRFPFKVFCTVRTPNIVVQVDEFKKLGAFVVGSINGLVCIACLGLGRSCFLWNPSMRQRRTLPKSSSMPVGDRKRVQVTFGFGHEPHSNDYKVVRVVNTGEGPSTRAEVYSLNSDSWKEVKIDFPLHNITRANCDVALAGFTHWLVKKGNGNEKSFVASFDLRKEVFRKNSVPEVVAVESEHYSAINFRGRLGLLAYGSQVELSKCLQVWILEEERNGVGVWNKSYTFAMDFLISHHWGLANGYIVVQNTPNVPFLYDPERKERKIIGIKQLDGVLYYVESLVSIKKLRRYRKSGVKKLK
ncbi:unnamed protein product [Cuscuta campestris]|uniref:F-box domain-containing protein n=2 Tax=Cuscuta sect. Cleistogrammica TaxID=1824901 RepID=A0A484NP54_9ASTE|nr:hypothetical protein DM860_007956 [Cuscuta australis]VFR03056.1 unnamed protein product [Cuscuta campestris]